MTFGERVRQARTRQHLTQREVAERLSVSQQTMGRYERLTDAPKTATVGRLADALGVPLEELLAIDTEKTASGKWCSYNLEHPEGRTSYYMDHLTEQGKQLVADFAEVLAGNGKYCQEW